ncbi:putative multidrug resistance protein MdtD [Metallosphaera sp. J1]|uniref:MFS transporter n=1 Tax=Metallosphaera javensis (ex Hofmann et al. 2022) TaxID=99938 RepID=UPI001EDD61A0|nr:MFS transporter [Metallosphaera javensis (ex Hofmann et al. 2022)]MCG3109329.1 putative multidrug resistance protein MdtD [Metallosphaera javensis (ex Hofmann et al. 2022)]
MRSEFWKYVPILAFISIMTMYVEMVVLPSLPKIETQFNVTSSEGSWILSSETLAGMGLAPFIGRLADSWGRKRVLMSILSIYVISVALTSLSPNFAILIASRSVQGIGLSINPLAYTLLRERLSNKELPVAQGVIASTFAVGAAVALPIGSFISEYYSWQFAYITSIPFLIASVILVYLLLPSSTVRTGERIDLVGVGLLSLGFLLIGVGFTEAPSWGWTSPGFLSLLALGGFILVYFGLRERRVSNPLINPEDLKNPNIAVPLLSSFITGFGLFLTFQSLVFIFELPRPVGYGYNILQTGETMAPISLILLIGGPLFGSLVNRIGYKRVILSSSVASTGALGLLAWVVGKVGVPELMGVLVLVLFFISGMNVTRITLLLASSSREKMSSITGTNTSMRLMGNTLGPIISGSLQDTYKFPLFSGFLGSIPLFTFIPSIQAFQYSFLISMASVICVVILATRIRESPMLTS